MTDTPTDDETDIAMRHVVTRLTSTPGTEGTFPGGVWDDSPPGDAARPRHRRRAGARHTGRRRRTILVVVTATRRRGRDQPSYPAAGPLTSRCIAARPAACSSADDRSRSPVLGREMIAVSASGGCPHHQRRRRRLAEPQPTDREHLMPERAAAGQAAGSASGRPRHRHHGRKRLSVGFQTGRRKGRPQAEMSQGFKLPCWSAWAGKDWTNVRRLRRLQHLTYLLSGVLLGTTVSGAGVDKTWSFVPAVRSSDVPRRSPSKPATLTPVQPDDAQRHHRPLLSWARRTSHCRAPLRGQVAHRQHQRPRRDRRRQRHHAAWRHRLLPRRRRAPDLGTTCLTRVIKARLDIKGRWSPSFFADSSGTRSRPSPRKGSS